MAYQPRFFSGAFSASSEARPSQVPPKATPWPIRVRASSTGAHMPMLSYPGMKATDTVEVPSSSRAVVSFAPRPNLRSMAMNRTVPSGRNRKARAKTAKESRVPPTAPA